MKKAYLMTLGALVLAASLLPLAASAAEVKNWEYKGLGHWTLQNQTTDIIYAQASVGKYPLYILYAKPYDEWFLSFSYVNDDGFAIMNEDGRRPTFFVRTAAGLGSGRYDSDYEIDRDFVVIHEKGVYSFSMLLKPEDIRALKSDLDIGADYWLDDGTPTHLWRTFRFPGTGAAAAIARIEAEIAKREPATSAAVPTWRTTHTPGGVPVGVVVDLEDDTSIGLRWSAENSWFLTFNAKPELPKSFSNVGIPVPGTDDITWLTCGAEYDPDRNIRKCFGKGAVFDNVLVMVLDDSDVNLIARANHLQVQTRDPRIVTMFSLKNSAAVIANIKQYHDIAN